MTPEEGTTHVCRECRYAMWRVLKPWGPGDPYTTVGCLMLGAASDDTLACNKREPLEASQ